MDNSDGLFTAAAIAAGAGLLSYICYSSSSATRIKRDIFIQTPTYHSTEDLIHSIESNPNMDREVKLYTNVTTRTEPMKVLSASGTVFDAVLYKLLGTQTIYTPTYVEEKQEEVKETETESSPSHRNRKQKSSVKSSKASVKRKVELQKEVFNNYHYVAHGDAVLRDLHGHMDPQFASISIRDPVSLLQSYGLRMQKIEESSVENIDPRYTEESVLRHILNSHILGNSLRLFVKNQVHSAKHAIVESEGGEKKVYYDTYKYILAANTAVFVWGIVGYDPVSRTFQLKHTFEISDHKNASDIITDMESSMSISSTFSTLFGLSALGALGFTAYKIYKRMNKRR